MIVENVIFAGDCFVFQNPRGVEYQQQQLYGGREEHSVLQGRSGVKAVGSALLPPNGDPRPLLKRSPAKRWALDHIKTLSLNSNYLHNVLVLITSL